VESNDAGLPIAVTDPMGNTTHYAHDPLGRVSAITDPLGGITRFTWTPEGKPASRTRPGGATEHWHYDAEGNLIQHVDAVGDTTRFEITFDQPSAQIGPDGARLEFAYDTELRLAAVTNPQGLIWRYDYDAAGNLVRETDFNGRELTYVYDVAGQLIERVNAVGEATHYTRDLVGNTVERRCGETVATFTYDAAGRLTQAVNADAEVRFERDRLGRVTAEVCNGSALSSTFDAAGRRVRRRTPSGAEAVWEYDPADRPVALRTAGQRLLFAYDAAGRETRRRIGGGAVLDQQWTADHQLKAQTLWGAPVPAAPAAHTQRTREAASGEARLLQHRTYAYRPDGYVTGIADHTFGGRRFDLDVTGRVTAVHAQGWSERYAYDSAGNLTRATWPTPPQAAASDTDAVGERGYAGSLIRRAGSIRYEHDPEGRITLRRHRRLSAKPDTWHYTWDSEDRLIAVTTPEGQRWRYRYDPLGRRVAKQRLTPDGHSIAEQTVFSWDGLVLAEQAHTVRESPDPTAVHVTTWEYEPGTFRPISQSVRVPLKEAPHQWIDQRFHAIVADLAGTPAEFIDTGGILVWRSRAALWGVELTDRNSLAHCPLRFSGQYHDPETGLNYNYFRYYDPTTARYGTSDPLGLASAPNSYTYISNPARWIDPLGLMPYPAHRVRGLPRSLDRVPTAAGDCKTVAERIQRSLGAERSVDSIRLHIRAWGRTAGSIPIGGITSSWCTREGSMTRSRRGRAFR
jgi:RHS repeat-associated protein